MVTSHRPLFGAVLGAIVVALSVWTRAQEEYDFAITPAFLQALETGRTILPTFRVHVAARSDIKDVGQDCEVHVAGTVLGQTFGDPDHVVVEPPNECCYKVGATTPGRLLRRRRGATCST